MADYVAADVIKTPWGNTNELRARRLRPGPGSPREIVSRSQRERLFAATVASTATKGYAATTVADLLQLAGVSRATFYEHFRDKSDCFRATMEALLSMGLGLIERVQDGEGSPETRAGEVLRAFLGLAVEQPAAARVCLVESYSAGKAGLEPLDAAFERACILVHETLTQLPGRDETPPELAKAVIGGLHRIVYRHLHAKEEQSLLECSSPLAEWALAFPPPNGLQPRRRSRPPIREPSSYTGRDLHERIIRGFASAVAVSGLQRTTIAHIAAEASISQATFYQHFANKEDVLLAALDLSGAQLAAAALPAARREPTWPQAIRRALEGICSFLVSEPAFARLRAVETYSAGPEILAHRDRAWEQVIEELVPAEIRDGIEPGPLALEASTGAIYALIFDRVRRDELQSVAELPPLATYVMLTPLLGAEEAKRVAKGGPPESVQLTTR